jgi:DNA-binding NarL/FixJ family response regulator
METVSHAPARVLIASHSPAWAAGMAAFLSEPPLAATTAATVDEALALLAGEPHALVLADARLADGPAADLAAEMRRRGAGVPLLLALHDSSASAWLDALAAGAVGCLPATAGPAEVRDAVGEALRGGRRADPVVLTALAGLGPPGGPGRLTDQERVVLRLMRQHLTYKEIAQRLGVSWHTVRTHAQSILRKSGVHSRRDLDAAA